jgi:hypothetical protein
VKSVTQKNRRLEAVSLFLEEARSQHITSMDVMLRRAGRGEISPEARSFFGLVEPLRLGGREAVRQASQLAPLVALEDVAIPDPPAAPDFARKTNAFPADHANQSFHDELVEHLHSWRDLKLVIAEFAQHAPLFHDGESTVVDLSSLGQAGEEAIAFISSGTTPPPDWVHRQTTVLNSARICKGTSANCRLGRGRGVSGGSRSRADK